MWIVRLALSRPYTFVVAALLLLLLTPVILLRTPTDIFPAINIPVVSVIWQYTGLTARDIEQRMVYSEERALTTTVNNIQHIESTSYDGVGVIKVFFQPDASPDAGVAQVTAVSQTILKQLPPGTTPPLVIQYNASTVPILQYGISSKTLSEQQTFDVAMNTIRVGLISVPGVGIPYPYGGKQRVVSVDLDPKALEAQNLSQEDVVTALTRQNLVFPSGTAKIGANEYPIDLNTSRLIDRLNNLPIKTTADGAVIRIRDVAQVHDGSMPQQNIVRQDGVRSTLISILKNGSASTLQVASGVKAAMAKVMKTVTENLEVKQFADQSVFVKAAISGVVREGVIAAALTALMILLFLGSWRSTLIIAISIPLSVLASLATLSAIGDTFNLMTLGGLALAVGILVDDATVTIENIERHLRAGETLENGILVGAGEIALPALVSTLCICIVFVPMFFLTGVAGFLFAPLAKAVVFAMLASYALVPHTRADAGDVVRARCSPSRRHPADPGFQAVAAAIRPFRNEALKMASTVSASTIGNACSAGSWPTGWRSERAFLAFCAASLCLIPFLGQDFFPSVDAGIFRLHVRAHTGTRIEETAVLVDRVESSIRHEIPTGELEGIIDNIGLPISGINLSYNDSGTAGPADADIMVSLRSGHRPTADYVRNLRLALNRDFPGVTFYFLPADIVSQTLNFGLPAPFDIQVLGRDLPGNQAVAAAIADKIRHVRGAVDVRIQQPNDLPRFEFAIDRTKASELGISESDIASSVLLNLSGSTQVQPTFWLDSYVGVQYLLNVRVPEYRMTSLSDLNSMPVTAGAPGTGNEQLLANLASFARTNSQPIYSHYNLVPVLDVFGGVGNRDLGGVLKDIKPIIAEAQKSLPRGSSIMLRGQAETMRSSFLGLSVGLAMAIALIYLLLVVNFQSWLDPFIILTALTGALAGVVWGLYLTATTLSVPAMMGAIMSLGVATSNSVLLVTFARIHLQEGMTPLKAAWEAGSGRLRPVLMTAMAMIIGMVPMALGMGEGGEQNAPLGRAVIGGLVIATFATLFFVPVVFSILHRTAPAPAKPESSSATAAPNIAPVHA